MKDDLNITHLKDFRDRIYNFFCLRKDASMDLIDSLSSNQNARSIVELSLSEFYPRNYCSITRSLDEFYSEKKGMAKEEINNLLSNILVDFCPEPVKEQHIVFGVDCTPAPRKHATTLKDRGFVHQPNTISGNKPITIGHQYSILTCFPEQERAPWNWPISCERVATKMKGAVVGMKQINHCIGHNKFRNKLCVSVGDSAYSTPKCINIGARLNNQVHVSRMKNNRVLYRMAIPSKNQKKGRPKKYGDKFDLKDENSHGRPDGSDLFESRTKKGLPITIEIASWNDLLMRGKRDMPMDEKPFRLMRVKIFKNGETLMFNRPLWIMVSGARRNELSMKEIYEIYRRRFDIEHFFRFGKNRLLMDKCQSPETDHEEAWWQFTMIAYALLYLSKELTRSTPKPWEKYLPNNQNSESNPSPSQVQNGLAAIIREIGTPAKYPKPRNKSVGRQKGDKQTQRTRYPVVVKGKTPNKKTE